MQSYEESSLFQNIGEILSQLLLYFSRFFTVSHITDIRDMRKHSFIFVGIEAVVRKKRRDYDWNMSYFHYLCGI